MRGHLACGTSEALSRRAQQIEPAGGVCRRPDLRRCTVWRTARLSQRTEQARSDVGDTVQALAEKIADETDLRVLARRGAALLAADARHATVAAARRPGSAARAMWVRGAQGLRHPGYQRTAAIGVPATLLLALLAWQVMHRRTRRG